MKPIKFDTKGKSWIGVDLDGTLAKLEPDKASPTHIGPPIKKMVDKLKKWHSYGIIFKIFTARVSKSWYDKVGPEVAKQIKPLIEKWCKNELGFIPEITAEKDYLMVGLIDDIDLCQVERNTGEVYTLNNLFC